MAETLSFGSRFFLAWAWFFRVLFDGAFAARVRGVEGGREPELLPSAPSPPPPSSVVAAHALVPVPPKVADTAPALQLLALLQREGRLIDFLEQDIVTFSDADVGVAARVVHEGCRKALRGHVEVQAVRAEEEGAKLVLEEGFDASTVKLVGNVSGSAPFRGTLRHKGWRAKKVSLPESTQGHDPAVLAPAEVEL